MPCKPKPIRKSRERANELEWAKRLIGQMQGEIDRMIKLNASLTESINNLDKAVD